MDRIQAQSRRSSKRAFKIQEMNIRKVLELEWGRAKVKSIGNRSQSLGLGRLNQVMIITLINHQ
jgi:hypothetical protein